MKLYQASLWKKVFKPSKKKKLESSSNQIHTIKEILEDLNKQTEQILPLLNTLIELEEERKVTRAGLQEINLKTQAKIMDQLLDKYSYIEDDIVINGIRLKHIASTLLEHAKKAELIELVQQRKKKWQLDK
ncbi:hypothetical protein HOI26_04315 [Candidatus Woesearchaeota archaeon]|jgi:hypothetical protein|nr:hypothetical protein [Candidatus Woesearchaeota archaeon]